MADDEMMVTEYELAETVFVPADNGAPGPWKRLGDLNPAELARYARELSTAATLQMERAERYATLAEKAHQVGLDREEFDELKTLKMTLDAQEREQDRRQAAIDRDKAASGYWTLPLHKEPPA
jgi:hypothetical protein